MRLGFLIQASLNLGYTPDMQILLVEDEPKILGLISKGLTEQRYLVDTASDGEIALEKCGVNEYDLIILDIMLPRVDGIEVCRQLRKDGIHTPILMLTAKDAVEAKVLGLDAGADDYLTKPFSFHELSARVRALLRRGVKTDPAILSIGDLSLNPASQLVTRGDKEINLTAREYALLEFFLRHPNQVLTKSEIIAHVWDVNYDGFSNIVETYVKYVRQKLKISPDSPELIHTVRGSGYILKKP